MSKFSLIDKNLVAEKPSIEGGVSKSKRQNLINGDSSFVLKETNASSSREVGGSDGLDPTRYGDWEIKGRCIDF